MFIFIETTKDITKKPILSDDLTFKKIFADEEIAKYTMELFFEFIKENKEIKLKVITEQSAIKEDRKTYKMFFADLIYELDNGEKINLEMYGQKFDVNNFNKSFSYMCRLVSTQLKKGNKKYDDLKHVYSINFIYENYCNITDEIVNVVNFRNEKHNKKYKC